MLQEQETITVYLDSDFGCHTEYAEGLTGYETAFFVGREHDIERYRIVPAGQHWTRADGKVFYGEMIAPIGKLKQNNYEMIVS